MKLRRLLSCMMALLLVCSLPVSALAAEYDLAQGSVIVNATESGQTVTHGTNAAVEDSAPVITQSTETTTNTITITAEENATANVTIQDVNIVISDPTDAPKDHSGEAAVTIDVADGAKANVTLDGVSIDTQSTGEKYVPDETGFHMILTQGEAAVQITGNGDVTLELDGENTVQSGYERAGVEKNTTDDSGKGELTITDETGTSGSLEATGGRFSAGIGGGYEGSGSNITITGSAEVTTQGGQGGAGIGGGEDGTGSDITIEGNAKVTAKGGNNGSGIGGGVAKSGSNITISGDAQVKAQGGVELTVEGSNKYFSAGAAIGDGGAGQENSFPDPGAEVDPDIRKLTPNGKIEYYAPGADMETDAPYKIVTGTYVPSQPAEPAQTAPLYRVIGQDGKALACKEARTSGVLTITAEADFATLTGSLEGMKTLKAQGVDTIVFVTKVATSTFAIADLLAQGGDSYALTHDGAAVTFTLGNGTDIGKILK